MTTVVLTLPLGFLSAFNAIIAFVWISTAALAFAVTRTGWHLLPVFLSGPFLVAVTRGQWSILLSAALFIPSLAFVFAAKPSIGLALLASNPSRRALLAVVAGGLLLALIGLWFVPGWPREWLKALQESGHQKIPIAHPAGLVALLALIRWRRADARLILALACVPQTLSWYETLPLLLVAQTFRQSLLLSLAACLPLILETANGLHRFYPISVGSLMLFGYLPSLILVLHRPNIFTGFSTVSRLGQERSPISATLRESTARAWI